MTNVEIYDTSNSALSSDEYSHEEDDELMDAAVSKQASPGNSPMKPGAGAGTSTVAKIKPKSSENADDKGPAAADTAGKDKIPETAAAVVQEPPSTIAETLRRIRQLQIRPSKYILYYRRRSLLWLRQKRERKETYDIGIQRKMAILRRRRYSSDSRSLSYSRSNRWSNSRSRSRSRSFDRSRSTDRSRSSDPSRRSDGSQSPELICLDDTENEDSPEKPEEAKAADVTPCKENKTKKILTSPPAQPQFEQQANEKSNENGTSSVLEEFLMIKEPKQPPSQAGIELDKLTASLELEEAIADTTLVQQVDPVEKGATAEEPMAVDATLKRRRSVTPPLNNDKRPKAEAEAFGDVDEDDDPIEFLPVTAQNSAGATPLIKEQPPKASVVTPAANPIQSQPAFKLSSPYTLALSSPAANTKQAVNLTALSHSLNTPTPPAVPMEISYPTDNVPPITKSNIVIAPPPEQPASLITVPAYATPSYAAPLQLAPPAQAAQAPLSVPAQDDSPRAAAPLQAATSGAVQGPFTTPQALVPPRALQPPVAVGPPRGTVPLQTASPRATGPLQVAPSRPSVPLQAAAPARPVSQPPPAQVHPEPPQVVVNAASFAVPQQPQPRRSETVSTQTQVDQPEAPPPPMRQKPAAPDLKNSEANFHHRLKELFPELDSILRERTDRGVPEVTILIEEIDTDLKTLDKLLDQKEDEWNRLLHLRCAKMELRERLERRERVAIIKKLLPSVINKGCSTAELYELQNSLVKEQHAPMPSLRSGPTAIEQCLNNVELNQSNIQRLRGVMGLKSRHFEEVQQEEVYRRHSLPAQQAPMRELRHAAEELEQRDYDMQPASKRPKLLRAHERYAHEMTNSTPNLAAAHNNLLVPGKPPYLSHTSSLDNHLENESQIKPLFNSSPMVAQRNLTQRQYDELHSTTYRNDEEMPEVSGSKGSKKSLRGNAASSTTNGKKSKCHHCQRFEAIYACSNCQNQWYCSRECQLGAWDSHYIDCGK